MTVEYLPNEESKRSIGRISAFQQNEELRQLQVLAGAQPALEGAVPGLATDSEGATDADVLAAWILQQGGRGAA